MVELRPCLPSSMAVEEDSKRKRSVEDAGGDRFAIEASMKECFGDSEPKPKPRLRLRLKLSAPKPVRRRSRPQLENIDHEEIKAAQNQFAAQVGLEEWNKQQEAKNGLLYELVNPGLCNPWANRGLFYHANFEAKPIGAPDSETQIFFAEIREHYYDDPAHVVHLCCPVEKLPAGVYTLCRGAELHRGCVACEDANIYHPAGSFRRGGMQYYV
ncbi:hypothetical protein Ancab_001269 [Ancistrocladus abbreviatus]